MVEGFAPDQLHHQIGQAVGQRAQRVDGRNAGVRQPGGDPRLTVERGGRHAGFHHLHGDITTKSEALGGVNNAHAAAGDLRLEPIAGNGGQYWYRWAVGLFERLLVFGRRLARGIVGRGCRQGFLIVAGIHGRDPEVGK